MVVDVLNAIEYGVDLFSSWYPTYLSTNAMALSLNAANPDEVVISFLKNGNERLEYCDNIAPFSDFVGGSCKCYCCITEFSVAYLSHLVNTNEMLGQTLLAM